MDPYASNDEELTILVVDTTSFILYHEIGHGLVDIYQLPITGKEEDAVDQFASIVMLETWESGSDAVGSAATYWDASWEASGPVTKDQFADEHSLDLQRFYTIVCLTYGYDTDSNSFLVEEEILPQERSSFCPYEYQKVYDSWIVLLEPYLK